MPRTTQATGDQPHSFELPTVPRRKVLEPAFQQIPRHSKSSADRHEGAQSPRKRRLPVVENSLSPRKGLGARPTAVVFIHPTGRSGGAGPVSTSHPSCTRRETPE